MLQLPEGALQEELLRWQLGSLQETTFMDVSVSQASIIRDAFAKTIYENIFYWVLRTINIALQNNHDGPQKDSLKIGVLDIFGFEVFDTNGIEQLCINFAK